MKRLLFALFCIPFFVSAASVNDLEFLEAFAWGDRDAALKELVPDTEDYFYYHALHYQLRNDRVAFDGMMKRWYTQARGRWVARAQELRRRQALIDFERDQAKTYQFIDDDLGLHFNHRPRHERKTPTYPSVLDAKRVSVDAFMQEAKGHHLLSRLSERGLERALNEALSPEQRRALLSRLPRPDVPGLVDMILKDLAFKNSRGFGSISIHRLLTEAQLVELGKRKPDLLRSQAYVNERLARIPVPDVDLSHDHAAAVKHYQELWAFVGGLGRMHNSLKASVLYRMLDHQRRMGIYDEELFREYLEYPRQVHYLPRQRREELQRNRAQWVNFNYSPGQGIVLPPIRNEEPLVREFLIELLRKAPNASAYHSSFESSWLNAVFAESKILHGVGRPEDWANLMSTHAYKSLLDRIELNFAIDNPNYLKPGEAVKLDVELKRVDELRIKVYELQSFNYYSTHKAPVDQAVDLDGMVATHERRLDVATDPGRRVTHSLAFPEINKRGVYVVELIGNGVSSRALLHIGHLESISMPTSAGQLMMVMNESGETVKTARIWMNGREFTTDDKGRILLPFSENPGVRFVVLRDGDFSSPEQIQHLGEDYSFSAGVHIDAQTLNRRSEGMLMLRPDLRLHGIPLDPALLGDVTVTLAATDAKGTRSERIYTANFTRNQEWARPFYVPEGLRMLQVSVEAKIRRKVDLEEITLGDAYVRAVNDGRNGDVRRQIFLVPTAAGWMLEVKGLNGEPVADLPLNVDVSRPGFQFTRNARLTTDDRGQVRLGTLKGVSRIQVSGADNLRLDRPLEQGAAMLPSQIHAKVGDRISLALPQNEIPGLKRASLFRVSRSNKFLVDESKAIQFVNGAVEVEGLASGSYQLYLHDSGKMSRIEVGEGELRSGFLLEGTRRLQLTGRELPSIAEIQAERDQLRLKLRNASSSTRVALRAYRYNAADGRIATGLGFSPPQSRRLYPPHMQYISGRNIGDEYRYVLERQLHKIFAGTLLERPGLILNPWELRETTAERERLKQDQAYRGGRQQLNAPAEIPARSFGYTSQTINGRAVDAFGGGMVMDAAESADLKFFAPGVGGGGGAGIRVGSNIGYDFLPQGSRWWLNLQPKADGSLEIPLEDLGEHTALEIVLMDRFGTVIQQVPLPDVGFEPREQRLTHGLNPEASFSRQKRVQRLEAGKALLFEDLATTRYQIIRDVPQAFDLLQTLLGDARMAKFSFLKRWPSLKDQEKLDYYSDYASHELHLFLYERDRAFFDANIAPFLKNKKDKTFVDRWLLDELDAEDVRMDRLQERNALELALLARRGGDADQIQNMLRESWELLPPDPDGFARLVRVALQAGELDEGQAMARNNARREAEKASKNLRKAKRLGQVEAAKDARWMAKGVASPAPVVAPAAPEAEMSLSLSEDKLMEVAEELGDRDELVLDFKAEQVLAGEITRLYRALPKTKEIAEMNYYEVRQAQDVAQRIPVSRFWLEVAQGEGLPGSLLEAHRSLSEALVALAFSGLPFETELPEEKAEGASMTLLSQQDALLVSEQILPAEKSEDERPLLLSQQFFRPDDMYRFEGNERLEKFIRGEFIKGLVYGMRVTLTNPTASQRRLNVLMQLPLGAIPLRNSNYTEDKTLTLRPYTTQTVELYFTFPVSGEYQQFPAHAAANEAIVGQAETREFNVVDQPTEVDKTSWAWISQYATPNDTLAFLEKENLRRVDLNEMLWRLRDKGFYERALKLLERRGLFHANSYSYAIHHRDAARSRIFLQRSAMLNRVGPVLHSPLLVVEPVEQRRYEHLEYDPLVNPRAHAVGEKRKILNGALNQQYRRFLNTAMYRDELPVDQQLALLYYLLLQDRLEEGLALAAEISAEDATEKMQLSYFQAWLALRTLEVDKARALVTPYVDVAVPRWRKRFAGVLAALDQAQGAEMASVDEPSRQQDLDRLAAQEPSIELELQSGNILLTAHNLKDVTLNLYPMDIELLFSRKPFLAEGGQDFAVIKPALSRQVKVKGKGEVEELELPRGYERENVMVEVTAKGKRASVAWVANQLKVRKMESYGQIELRSERDNKVLPKAYVKVFARGSNGQVSFWKDGYSDLRGRFDYLSLNDRQPEEAVEFSILVLHPELGAEILQAEPPLR